MKERRRVGLGRRWRAAAALVLATLSGCDRNDGGAVRVVAIGDRQARLLDPAAGRASPADLLLVANVAQGLVRFDAAGDIVPGLAERWAVSNDGLSYVFRLRKAEWSDGRRVRARDVVRLLERQRARASRNPLRDTVGAIGQIVAMTDRVVAIELSAPRPHLLQLLAQPEFGLVREGSGTGPFRLAGSAEDGLELVQQLPGMEEEQGQEERVRLATRPADAAIREFAAGRAELVLGGTSADLALALGARLPRGSLRIDPAAGLFGLVPARATGPAASVDVRALLDQALDRSALMAALGVPQAQPRASLLQPGLDGIPAPAQPNWAAVPLAERRAELVQRTRTLFDLPPPAVAVPAAEGAAETDEAVEAPIIRVSLPPAPGGLIILQRLRADWEPLGLKVEQAPPGRADFRWVDEVAPSTSPAWFLRSFRCEAVPVCSPDADRLLDAARLTGFAPQRFAFFAEAERRMREEVLFLPVAAPVRWSLVRGIEGFKENRFARHTLTGLREGAGAQD